MNCVVNDQNCFKNSSEPVRIMTSFPSSLVMQTGAKCANPELIDTMKAGESKQSMPVMTGSALFAQLENPHQLKEPNNDKTTSYDEEEFNMNEQSEEGTADDYDSMAENQLIADQSIGNPVIGNKLVGRPRLRAEKSRESLQTEPNRPSLQEFEEEESSGCMNTNAKRRRPDPFQI